MVKHYKTMQAQVGNTSMYEEVRWQYISMAQGGDGGPMGFSEGKQTTCRSYNYSG